jgi:hypothetical protein
MKLLMEAIGGRGWGNRVLSGVGETPAAGDTDLLAGPDCSGRTEGGARTRRPIRRGRMPMPASGNAMRYPPPPNPLQPAAAMEATLSVDIDRPIEHVFDVHQRSRL